MAIWRGSGRGMTDWDELWRNMAQGLPSERCGAGRSRAEAG